MKTKNFEKLMEEYGCCCDVQIGIDGTDHIVFICNECKLPLEVIEVSSENMTITTNGKIKDNCTWIKVVCHHCKSLGQRKFYWKSEDGRYCFHKTYRTKDDDK